jgi:hypothetical protein
MKANVPILFSSSQVAVSYFFLLLVQAPRIAVSLQFIDGAVRNRETFIFT